MTDELCKHPESTASQVNVGAATYRGKSNAWLETVGHRKIVHFANGESHLERLNIDFSHLIGDLMPLWTLLLLDANKNFIQGALKQGDWDHLQMHREASKSRAVDLYLELHER